MANYLADGVLCVCGHPAYKHIFGAGPCGHEDGRGHYCDCPKHSLPMVRKAAAGFEVTAFSAQATKPKRAWNSDES